MVEVEKASDAVARTLESSRSGPDLPSRTGFQWDPRRVFFLALFMLAAIKLVLATVLPLFGDEAFYWQESRALAPGYSDIPPLVPWLIRLGTSLGGHAELAVRAPFLLLGAMLPWLVVVWARRLVAARDAWWAGVLALCLPIPALLGLLALPDVPLTVAMLLGVIALQRALEHDGLRAWMLLGGVLALGWMSHYRFVMFYVAGAAFVLATPRGGALLRNPRFWLAQGLGLLGLLPALVFNAQTEWVALRFQFLERHPWRFHADAFAEPVVQALVTTPLLFVAVLFAMTLAVRRRLDATRPYALLAATSVGLLGGFLVFGLIADAERVRFHWPLPAYLIALPLVPAVLRTWWTWPLPWRPLTRAAAVLAPLLAASLLLAMTGLLWHAAAPAAHESTRLGRWLTDNTSGWHDVGRWARARVADAGPDVVVADNFMLAAELDFAFAGARPVFVLDHPLNRKHGRAAQLAIWQRDAQTLARTPWKRGLLFFEEASRRPLDRLDAYRELCGTFGGVRAIDELVLHAGHTRYAAFAVVPRGALVAECEVPAFGYIDEPAPGARIDGETFGVRGWAFKEFTGVARVELLFDGIPNGDATYGMEDPRVRGQWPQSQDPNHPRVGFMGMIMLDGVARGEHRLALRVIDPRGRVRVVAEQTVHVGM